MPVIKLIKMDVLSCFSSFSCNKINLLIFMSLGESKGWNRIVFHCRNVEWTYACNDQSSLFHYFIWWKYTRKSPMFLPFTNRYVCWLPTGFCFPIISWLPFVRLGVFLVLLGLPFSIRSWTKDYFIMEFSVGAIRNLCVCLY